jgi:hypothetical protein
MAAGLILYADQSRISGALVYILIILSGSLLVYILIILSGSLLVFYFDAYGIVNRNLVLIIPVILRMST